MLALDPAKADPQDLRAAIVNANKAIVGRGDAEEQLFGMGTTITAALVHGEALTVAHVGDSRAYVLHDGELAQLTEDHSWVGEMVRRGEISPEQAATHPHRSVITRALGTDDDVDPDLTEVPISPGDRLLLCSDGLTGMVSDQQIVEILLLGNGPQETADALVGAALARGGEDNVTVVVVDVDEDEAVAGADGETGGAAEAMILIGPSDRSTSAAATHRRRSGVSVRERFGRKTIPPLRPAGHRGGVVPGPKEAADLSAASGLEAVPEAGSADTAASGSDETVPSSGTPGGDGAPAVPSIGTEGPAPVGESAQEAVTPRRKRRRWVYWVCVVVLVVALAIGGLAWFNSTVYYVGTSDGKVALYHGLPATVLGVDLSRPVEWSTVTYESLTPYLRAQVDSHDLISKEEGQSFLRTLSGEQ
jgi:protein phosphatase